MRVSRMNSLNEARMGGEGAPPSGGRTLRTYLERTRRAWAWAGLLLAAAGCTPAQYARQADDAAYRVLREKQRYALGETRPFDIDYKPFCVGGGSGAAGRCLLGGKPIPWGASGPRLVPPPRWARLVRRLCAGAPAWGGPVARLLAPGRWLAMAAGYLEVHPLRLRPCPPRILSLRECLEIAFSNSRSFQTRRERLYTSALALANLRHKWSLPAGELRGEADYVKITHESTTRDGSAESGLSFAQKFASGAVLTLGAGLDAATNFLNIRDTSFGSLLEANVTQPLLRGGWRGFAYEELYRAERDFAYEVLQYERFTQEFAVKITTDYYDVLRARDELQNESENRRRLEQTFKFVAAQVKAGMVSRVQADIAEQNVLDARSRIQTSQRRYRDALDNFKITLGLPIVANVELDQRELTRLKPKPIPFKEQEAIRIALRTRPDVLTNYARARDARRDVEIAADAFNPRLDLVLGISAPGTDPRKPFRMRFHDNTRSASLSFEYQLDQTDNRDAYRQALIDYNKARRDLEEFLDTVRLDVRASYRSLLESRRTYEIQKAAVALANRRTKLARREQKEGLASTRDVVEAEDALRASKNRLTAALVSYVTTRLSFLATLGMISVDEQGHLHERSRPFYFDRVGREKP